MFLDETVALVGGGLYGVSDELDCNAYLLLSKGEAGPCGCRFAGFNPTPLRENIRRCGCPVAQLHPTHSCSCGHASGITSVQTAFGGQVVASEPEARLVEAGSDYELGLEHAKRSGSYPQDFRYVHHRVDMKVQHGAVITVGDLTVHALVVPGHSVGGTCYLVEGDGQRRLFTGDTVISLKRRRRAGSRA